MLRLSNKLTFLGASLLASISFLAACENDEAEMPVMPDGPTGSLQVNDQLLSSNKIIVPAITMSKTGWVVVHKSTADGGPVVPAIISVPKQLMTGTSSNVEIMLKDEVMLEDGETLWVMLHTDDGVMGSYEFDGQNGLDGPIMEGDMIVMESIEAGSPMIVAEDQAVMNGMVTIAEVNAAVDGWLVIHNDNGSGQPIIPEIIGKTWVEAGSSSNVMVALDEGVMLQAGQKLFPMLHVDSPANETYDFPDNGDAPEMFGTGIIMVDFTVQ
ncbi:hypothetical protein [Cesiribacter sp. SM1]|uniref:DUF7282 domain-containing protein n=1 Tax=Cesiribacter sp. SM1 TaxID=2861196 RepID=UPI001CD1E69C|nr:hypothetical protein [Cesiribacter sp. SM1]